MSKSDHAAANKRPTLDPLKSYWRVDTGALLAGDIVLTRSPGQLTSDVITLATKGEFSHAFLCSSDPAFCVESADHGVILFSMMRFLIKDPENVRVLRMRDRDAKAVERAAEIAQTQVSRKYADRDVLTALAKSIPPVDSGCYFCSQLVSDSYRIAGIELVPGVKPAKTTPQMICESALLQDISQTCVVVAAESHRIGFTGFLDGEVTDDTPASRENAAKQKIFADVRQSFTDHGLHVTKFDDCLTTVQRGCAEAKPWANKLDDELSRAIRDSGWLEILREYAHPAADMFFIDLYWQHALSQPTIPPLASIVAARDHYGQVLEIRRGVNAERFHDLHIFRQAFVLSPPVESFRLYLAIQADTYAFGERTEEVLVRLLKTLDSAIHQLEAQLSSNKPTST